MTIERDKDTDEIICPDCEHGINQHRYICQMDCSCMNSASEIADMFLEQELARKDARLTAIEQAAREAHECVNDMAYIAMDADISDQEKAKRIHQRWKSYNIVKNAALLEKTK